MADQVYEPRGGARELLTYKGPEVLISGAAGTGKSLAALYKIHILTSQIPNITSLLLRATHTSIVASTLVTFEKQVAAQSLADGDVTWYGGSGRIPPHYRYPNGSRILVGGLDQPGRLLSQELSFVFVDEANQVSITAYETILTRLREKGAPYRQAILACNPDHPKHWAKLRADEGKLHMINSLHRDNPYLMDRNGTPTETGQDYFRFLDALTGTRRSRFKDGLWVAAEGLVFDSWRDDVNLVDPFDVPDDWDCFWSVDFGYQNQFVWQCWRVSPDGCMYLTHELSHRQRLVEDHARWILKFMDTNALPRPRDIVCDHDSEDRATLERHLCMTTVAAKKAVTRGVQLTDARIRVAGNGRPRLSVFRTAIQTTDPLAKSDNRPRGMAAEVNGYVWAMERGDDGVPREAPRKVNDHSMDAARYAVAHLDWDAPARKHNPAAARPAASATNGTWSRPVGR